MRSILSHYEYIPTCDIPAECYLSIKILIIELVAHLDILSLFFYKKIYFTFCILVFEITMEFDEMEKYEIFKVFPKVFCYIESMPESKIV